MKILNFTAVEIILNITYSISCEWSVQELMERYIWKNKKWVLREGLVEL